MAALRIVLFGTGEFALPTFRRLIQSGEVDVAAVFTQPDKTGRGHHRHKNVVKSLAQQFDLPVFQPANVNAEDVLQQLRSIDAQLFFVASYGQILRPEFLEIAPMGAFNLHGSLLPRHRGAAPVQYSIWKGDRLGGLTIFQIEKGLDSGPMIAKRATPIDAKDTSATLSARLAEMGADLTVSALRQLADDSAKFESQDPGLVTLAPRIRKEQGIIDWTQHATQVDCHVRAMQPWPKASTILNRPGYEPLRCILLDTDPLPDSDSEEPGTVHIRNNTMTVSTAQGLLRINRLQPEGRKPMDAAAFLNGHPVPAGSVFRQPQTQED